MRTSHLSLENLRTQSPKQKVRAGVPGGQDQTGRCREDCGCTVSSWAVRLRERQQDELGTGNGLDLVETSYRRHADVDNGLPLE